MKDSLSSIHTLVLHLEASRGWPLSDQACAADRGARPAANRTACSGVRSRPRGGPAENRTSCLGSAAPQPCPPLRSTCVQAAGWWGIFTSALAFYIGLAMLFEDMWGKEVCLVVCVEVWGCVGGGVRVGGADF